MRKLICFIVLVSFGFSGHSQKSGIEIYFLQKYQNTEPKCCYCFDEKKLVFSDKPILEENDIDYFDWKKQKITLSKTGKNKISKLKIALSGIPVVMVLNNKLIYGFWFWNNFSSFGCDRVYTYPKKDFKIKFGLPSNNIFGVDPRFNPELKKYILKKFPQHYSVD